MVGQVRRCGIAKLVKNMENGHDSICGGIGTVVKRSIDEVSSGTESNISLFRWWS
jgi:Flp pilus assembly CpaF family ATPase